MFRISYSRACQVFICVLPVLFQKASPLQLAFWKDRAGSGAHPQPGLPWRREGEPRGGGPLSPHLLSPASRGSPGEDRTSHAAGQTEAALPPSPRPAPLRGRATRGEAAPHLLTRLPSVPSARPAHLDGRRERELGDARPRGRTRLLPSPALPPGKQIPELNGNTQKVPSLTPNSTTRLG